ncbi:hypothetical protein Q8791_12575 [Nocardiopsis sp. CT-R113]|uniref:DUF8129 domain-containing protein n=1 Tax=Nocardiopsis codii TaxID=3065942 RepID=A0ABU7K733_9ACTN|nr:hypothetical protein [Nocardiopsis sp. CT-R113]MEE2038051.1 hypothetical protein [Nocardiopsis sp. CT-R113]
MSENTPPIEGYEGLPIASLQHRVRSLDEEQMRQLIGYEEEHAKRVGVLEILRNRLRELEAGAEPSGGSQRFQPERPGPPAGGSPVGEATAAPQASPPPHGVPAQPAKPKGDYQPGGQ